MNAYTLSPQQRYAADWIKTHPFCGLFLDMGVGKTLATLTALYELNEPYHVLVIAPKNIAYSVWRNEIEKWDLPIRFKSLIVDEKGRDLKPPARYELYQNTLTDQPTVYFINREKMKDLMLHLPQKQAEGKRKPVSVWPFGTVVIDESQGFKSGKSTRFKVLKLAREYIQRMILLTGTPTPRSLEDLWAQVYLLDGGERLGKYITHYRAKWFYPTKIVNDRPVDYKPQPHAEAEIFERISDICVSGKTNVKLPPLTIEDIDIVLDESTMKRYRKFMTKYVLDPLTADGRIIEASSAGVLANKLSQMASGAIYTPNKDGEFKGDYMVVHEHKLDMLEYLLDNTSSNVIVAYHYKSDLAMITERFAKTGRSFAVMDSKPDTIANWNAGKIPVLLLQPASAGHGLNLQHGGHTLIWYTLTWSLEEYQQTNARLYRQGQTQPVTIYRLKAKDTIDSRIAFLLKEKAMSQDSLLEAVKMSII